MFTSFVRKIFLFLEDTFKKTDWKCIGIVSIAFFSTRLMVFLVTYASMAQIHILAGGREWQSDIPNIILEGLTRWDSLYYIPIADDGYFFQATAFFPLYPILIRIFAAIFTNSVWTSGIWISNIAFFIALNYIYLIAKQEFDNDTAARSVFYIACAPAAFFFSTPYTESIFLLLISATFYYSRNEKWVLAAIAGALASMTKLTGSVAAVVILVEALWLQGVRFIPKPWSLKAQLKLVATEIRLVPKTWKGIVASIFSLSGLFGYMYFLYQKFGDPIAFLHAEKDWNKVVSWDWIIRLGRNIIDTHSNNGKILSGDIGGFSSLPDTLSLFIFIPLVIIVLLKFKPSFGMYSLMAFIVPLVSGTPTSMRRYVLLLIPCYFLLALWGKRPWVDRLIIIFSLPLQALGIVLFTHWYWAG